MITIAVLLTCYNRREITLTCLRTLYNCNLPNDISIAVFLVDDGSADNTAEAVKEEFPNIHLIFGDGNLFWNRGMHLAWDIASKSGNFDFYLWLNDDVELFPNAIIDLLVCVKEKNSIVTGTMRSIHLEYPTYGGRDIKGNLVKPNGIPQKCNAFNGNLVLVPAKVFEKIGNLDPLFPHTMGDYDYALRAKKKNITNLIAPYYSGYCEKHAKLADWCHPEVPFKKRLKSLYSPLANSQPFYYFHFELRHYGFFKAIKHFLSIHLRLIYPRLWK